jgi:hypothetical protein
MVALCFHLPRRFFRRVLFVVLALVFFFVLSKLTGNSIDDDEEWYKHPDAYFKEITCDHDDYTMNQFEELAQRMSATFEKLNITYFLCYGSLWGALKFQKTLPWDRNVDVSYPTFFLFFFILINIILINKLILINRCALFTISWHR